MAKSVRPRRREVIKARCECESIVYISRWPNRFSPAGGSRGAGECECSSVIGMGDKNVRCGSIAILPLKARTKERRQILAHLAEHRHISVPFSTHFHALTSLLLLFSLKKRSESTFERVEKCLFFSFLLRSAAASHSRNPECSAG